jgi:hypothetical protein
LQSVAGSSIRKLTRTAFGEITPRFPEADFRPTTPSVPQFQPNVRDARIPGLAFVVQNGHQRVSDPATWIRDRQAQRRQREIVILPAMPEHCITAR